MLLGGRALGEAIRSFELPLPPWSALNALMHRTQGVDSPATSGASGSDHDQIFGAFAETRSGRVVADLSRRDASASWAMPALRAQQLRRSTSGSPPSPGERRARARPSEKEDVHAQPTATDAWDALCNRAVGMRKGQAKRDIRGPRRIDRRLPIAQVANSEACIGSRWTPEWS